MIVGIVGQFEETANGALPAGSPSAVWTSSDVTIATVESPNPDTTGKTIKVTPIAPGTFTLTSSITESNGNVVQGSLSVSVLALATALTVTELN